MLNRYQKYKRIILYLIFGFFTSLVNIIIYLALTKVFNLHYMASNIAAWIASVMFAYITNRLFVFVSQSKGLLCIIGECAAFFGCRLFSGLADTTIMYVMINLIHLNDMFVKIIANLIVIILNYVFSKQVIFKNKDQKEVNII